MDWYHGCWMQTWWYSATRICTSCHHICALKKVEWQTALGKTSISLSLQTFKPQMRPAPLQWSVKHSQLVMTPVDPRALQLSPLEPINPGSPNQPQVQIINHEFLDYQSPTQFASSVAHWWYSLHWQLVFTTPINGKTSFGSLDCSGRVVNTAQSHTGNATSVHTLQRNRGLKSRKKKNNKDEWIETKGFWRHKWCYCIFMVWRTFSLTRIGDKTHKTKKTE